MNDAAAELGSNRDRHASIGEGSMGEGLGVFLAHPAFQDLPAILETPGPDGHGPDAEEIRRLRLLHRRAVRRAASAMGAEDNEPRLRTTETAMRDAERG